MKNDSIEVLKGKKYQRKGSGKKYIVTDVGKDIVRNEVRVSFVELDNVTGRLLSEEISLFIGAYVEIL
jgi:hypothetical protein